MIRKLALFLGLILLILGALFCVRTPDYTELSFSTWGTATEMKVLKELISDYESQNPKVKIKLQHIPQNYFKKLHLLFASKTEPDVILINNQYLPIYKDFLLDLPPLSTDFRGVMGLSCDGVLKAVPRDLSVLVLYYNKSLLENSNLILPNEWNLESFLKLGKSLQAKNRFLISLEDDLYYLYPFILASGEKINAITSENITTYRSFDIFRDLSRKYHYAPLPYELGVMKPADLFFDGKTVFYLSGRWMYPKISELAKFDFGVVEFPKGKVPCDVTGWAISKRSSKQEEALKFVNYLSSRQSLLKMAETGLIIPSRRSCWVNLKHKEVFLSSILNSIYVKYSKSYSKERDSINTILKQQ